MLPAQGSKPYSVCSFTAKSVAKIPETPCMLPDIAVDTYTPASGSKQILIQNTSFNPIPCKIQIKSGVPQNASTSRPAKSSGSEIENYCASVEIAGLGHGGQAERRNNWIRQIRLTKPLFCAYSWVIWFFLITLKPAVPGKIIQKALQQRKLVSLVRRFCHKMYGTSQIKIAYAYASCLVGNM